MHMASGRRYNLPYAEDWGSPRRFKEAAKKNWIIDLRFTNSNQVLTCTEDQQLEHADQSKSMQDIHNSATSRNHDLEEIE